MCHFSIKWLRAASSLTSPDRSLAKFNLGRGPSRGGAQLDAPARRLIECGEWPYLSALGGPESKGILVRRFRPPKSCDDPALSLRADRALVCSR